MVDQSFVHNLNSLINQVSESGKSLVPMTPPQPGPPPILHFVITDASTTGQYFVCKGTSKQHSDNIIYSISIKGEPNHVNRESKILDITN